MNIPLIVLLVIKYGYSIHFTCFYCSYKNNKIKYLGTSSKILIEGSVSLTHTKEMQDILERQNVTYPLNSQFRIHNIQRGAGWLDRNNITTNIGKINFRLRQKYCLSPSTFDFMDFRDLRGDFWSHNEIVSYDTHTSFEKHLGAMLFTQNT